MQKTKRKETLKHGEEDQVLFGQCLKNAEGNEIRARAMYLHRRNLERSESGCENPDDREKWPMLLPLLILYSLGTVGVLVLVFGFLGCRLSWW